MNFPELAEINIEFLKPSLFEVLNDYRNFPEIAELYERLEGSCNLAAAKQFAVERGGFGLLEKLPEGESPYDVEDEVHEPKNHFSYNPKRAVSIVHFVRPSTGERGFQKMSVDTFLKLLRRLPLDIRINHQMPHDSPISARLDGDNILICPYEEGGVVTQVDTGGWPLPISGASYGYGYDQDVPHIGGFVIDRGKDAKTQKVPDIPALTYSFKPSDYGVKLSFKDESYNGKPKCSNLENSCEACTKDNCLGKKAGIWGDYILQLTIFLKHLKSFNEKSVGKV